MSTSVADRAKGTTASKLANRTLRPVAEKTLAQAPVPGGIHVGLPCVVPRSGAHRYGDLVQLGPLRSSLQGLSFRWWWGDPTDSLWHDPDLHNAIFQTLRLSITTMFIAVPLGVLFAVGLDR